MRAAQNIVFGILLLVMQAMASIAPHTVSEGTICQCCSCGSKACSTPQTTAAPTASPLAAHQQPANEKVRVSLPAPRPTPAFASRQTDFPSPISDSASRPPGWPLFQRFCALLI